MRNRQQILPGVPGTIPNLQKTVKMTRKRFSSEFKAKVAIEALNAHKTINELATEFDVHPTQINVWKR